MVKLNKIYTRTGDDGTTGLGSGKRVKKNAPRINLIGTIDETNAHVGLARLHTQNMIDGTLDDMLARIQNDLFDIGADLCLPGNEAEQADDKLRVSENQVSRLEAEIDTLNAELHPLTSFVLPGGTPAASHLHLARTVARRAERLAIELADIKGEHISLPVLHYLNRLSDFFFVAARSANDNGAADVLWTPGENI